MAMIIPIAAMPSKRRTFVSSENSMSTSSKGFNINVSRLSSREGQGSMLAYSDKLRNFKEARERGILAQSLQVNAKRIPKYTQLGTGTKTKLPKRKPHSLQELTGRKSKSLDGDDVDRSLSSSPCLSLPDQTSRVVIDSQPSVSFLSSSDLNDIVGYRIKPGKVTDDPNEQMRQLNEQKSQLSEKRSQLKSKITDFLRSSVLPPIRPSNKPDSRKTTHNSTPRYGPATRILRRPNRVKRMHLHGSFLYDIPEIDSSASPSALTDSDSNNQTVSSSKLQSRNSLLNQDEMLLRSSLERHIPTSSLIDKLGVNLVNFTSATQTSQRHNKIPLKNLDDQKNKPHSKNATSTKRRLVFLTDRTEL